MLEGAESLNQGAHNRVEYGCSERVTLVDFKKGSLLLPMILHNIVRTHLFILHINQQVYFMERNIISRELLNTQTPDEYQHVAKILILWRFQLV